MILFSVKREKANFSPLGHFCGSTHETPETPALVVLLPHGGTRLNHFLRPI
jgi:hypothetical protein